MPNISILTSSDDDNISGISGSGSHNQQRQQQMNLIHKQRSDANSSCCDTVSVITRSPSPFDDIGSPTEASVQVIMEELTSNSNGSNGSVPAMPDGSAPGPSKSGVNHFNNNQQPPSQQPQQQRGSRIGGRLSLRKKSSSLIKSFTAGMGPGGSSGNVRMNSLVSSVGSIDEAEILNCGNGSIGISGHSLSGSSQNLDDLIGQMASNGNTDDISDDEGTSDMYSTPGDSQLDVELPKSNGIGGNSNKMSKKWNPKKTSSRLKNNLMKSFTGGNMRGSGSGKSGGKYNTNHSSHPIIGNNLSALKSGGKDNTNHSSHPIMGNNLSALNENKPLRRNSDEDCGLTEMIRQTSGDAMTTRDVARMLQNDLMDDDFSVGSNGSRGSGGSPPKFATMQKRQSSTLSNFSNNTSDHDLDDNMFLDSRAMLESLGDTPTSMQLANVAAVRAKEYIEECLSADVESGILDRKKWDAIPQFTKSDLVVGQHLGKGSFSDAFEVFATVVEEDYRPTLESLGSDRKDLDKLLEKRFNTSNRGSLGNRPGGVKQPSIVLENDEELSKIESDGGDTDLDKEIEAMFGQKEETINEEEENEEPSSPKSGDDLDKEIDAKFGGGSKNDEEESGDDLDKEIEAMFGSGSGDDKNDEEESKDDLDKELEAMFGSGSGDDKKEEEESKDDLDKELEARFGEMYAPKNLRASKEDAALQPPKGEFAPQRLPVRRPSRRACGGPNRRATHDMGRNMSGSICLGTVQSRHSKNQKPKERRVVLAMKCLRPQIRSNADQFIIGVEDLVHETAMLASLDHPNIVKIHGRAGGCLSNSFRLSDGFFILLDRLKDTLDDRIVRWKKASKDKRAPPTLPQIKAAMSVADSLSYLHSKKICFRDLKPQNVGFDSSGTLKLFDFGFAIGVEEPLHTASMCGSDSDEEYDGLLYDKCGTPRYMAPEVGLEKGYALPADVYSFGILLWEICALKKPYGNVRSADEFHKTVFEKGARPKLGKYWPESLKDVIVSCWSEDPDSRPDMKYVKSMLAAHVRQLSLQQQRGGDRNSLRKSWIPGRRRTNESL